MECTGFSLNRGLNEQFLLCGTTVELAEYAQATGEAVLLSFLIDLA